MCYTLKCLKILKNGEGFSTSAGGCTTTFVESTDTKLINETVCNNPDVKSHSIVETTKISDTEFAMTMKSDVDAGGNKQPPSTKLNKPLLARPALKRQKA